MESEEVGSINNAAIALKNAGKLDLAADLYQEAIDKGSLEAIANLGILRFLQKRYFEGVKLLEGAKIPTI